MTETLSVKPGLMDLIYCFFSHSFYLIDALYVAASALRIST